MRVGSWDGRKVCGDSASVGTVFSGFEGGIRSGWLGRCFDLEDFGGRFLDIDIFSTIKEKQTGQHH
jgi:hypothetical protein